MLEKALIDFGRRWQQQSRSNLTKGGKNVSKELYNATKYQLKKENGRYTLVLESTDYADYVDKGVQGKASKQKAPKSPYRFGSGTGRKGGLTDGIRKWVKARRIQFQNQKNKRWLSYESTAWLITRSVYLTGTKPSYFYSKPFENEYKKLPEEVLTGVAEELRNAIEQSFKK